MWDANTDNFDAFFQTYRRLCFAVAYRILRDVDDAEDVVQNVFFKAWSAPERFHGGNIESWLTTLAKNRAIDVLRKNRRNSDYGARERHLAIVDNTWQMSDESMDLSRAIRALTSDQRRAIAKCFIEAYPHAEAAKLLGLPVGTLKTRIRAGVRRMRSMHLV